MKESLTVSTFKIAANALKSAGSSTPIPSLIDTISRAITGGTRERKISAENKGVPPEVKNLLGLLKLQLHTFLTTIATEEQSELWHHQVIENLEVIESFSDRVIESYFTKAFKPTDEEEELVEEVKTSFTKARSQLSTSLSLQKMMDKVAALMKQFKGSTEITAVDYKEKLKGCSRTLEDWEKDWTYLKDSPNVATQIYRLKELMRDAYQLSELQEPPGIAGEHALKQLKVASELAQYAKDQFQLEEAVVMAKEAEKDLVRSGADFQEKGRAFRLIIEQSVAQFLQKKLMKMESLIQKPWYFNIENLKANLNQGKRIVFQIRQLEAYFILSNHWVGPHKRNLQERIALIFETLTLRARHAKGYLFDSACSDLEINPEKIKSVLQFRLAECAGRDLISPEKIFRGEEDEHLKIQKLFFDIPEPSITEKFPRSFTFFAEKVYELISLGNEDSREQLFKRVQVFLEHFTLESNPSTTKKCQEKFLLGVTKQENYRFLKLMRGAPNATTINHLTIEKPRDVVDVMTNYRVMTNFLEGKYGPIQSHPIFKKVTQEFELQQEALMIRDFLLAFKERGVSVKREELYKALKEGERNSYSAQLLEQCRRYQEHAKQLLFPFAKGYPEFIQKAAVGTVKEVLSDAENLEIIIPYQDLREKGKEARFCQDLESLDLFPCYVEGTLEPRKKEEEIESRLKSYLEEDHELYNEIQHIASGALFTTPLEKLNSFRDVFCSIPNVSSISAVLEQKALCFSYNSKEKKGILTGFATLNVIETLVKQKEIGAITLRADVEFQEGSHTDLIVRFIDLPFHQCISSYKKNSYWSTL